MLSFRDCGLAFDANGQPLPGCVIPYNQPANGVGYVMIDPGTPLPHVVAAPQFSSGLGQDETETETPLPATTPSEPPPELTSKQLFSQLYQKNKWTFWIGGGVVSLLALSGLYDLVRR